jgi:hypothetical protein
VADGSGSGHSADERWLTILASDHGVFTNVLKKFFTASAKYENNTATSKETVMKNAIKTLLSHPPRGAVEDLLGLAALFVILFAVLSLPGLA